MNGKRKEEGRGEGCKVEKKRKGKGAGMREGKKYERNEGEGEV